MKFLYSLKVKRNNSYYLSDHQSVHLIITDGSTIRKQWQIITSVMNINYYKIFGKNQGEISTQVQQKFITIWSNIIKNNMNFQHNFDTISIQTQGVLFSQCIYYIILLGKKNFS